MKQKLALLLLALVITMGAWADVTVNVAKDGTNGPQQYGTGLNNATNHPDFTIQSPGVTLQTTWTSTAASGMAGLKVETSNATLFSQGNIYNIKGFCLHPTAAGATETVTITAPSGYYIKGYSLNVASWNTTESYTLSAAGATSITSINTEWRTFSVSNNTTTSTSFKVKANNTTSNQRYLIITSFSVTLAAIPSYDANHTSYDILYSSGTFSRSGGGTSEDSNNTWESSSLSDLTFTSNYNSMGKKTVSETIYTCLHSGYSPTYTITAPTGYLIAGYSMSVFGEDNQYITPKSCSKISLSTSSSNPTQIYVTDINAQTTTMQRTGDAGGWAYIKSFKVYLIPTYSVTYNIVDDGGNVMATKAVAEKKGSTPSVPTSISNSFCDYGSFYTTSSCTGEAVTTISSATTLYTRLSVNSSCPVSFSTIGTPTWYYLQLRDIYPSAASSDATYPTPSASPVASSGGAWVFIGNPYKFYLYNKLTTKYLEKNSSAASDSENGTQFTTTPFEWQMNAHDAGGSSFRIYTKATADNAKPTHIFSNNTYIMWLDWSGSGSGEVGGKFVVSEYSDDFTSQVTSNIKPFFDKYASDGEVYFGISTATYNSYNSAYTTALSTCTEDTYNELYENVVTNGLKWPADGYYRLKNVANGDNYLAYSGDLTVSTNTSSTSVLYIDVQNDGTMSIALQGSNYIQMPAGSTLLATLSSTPMMYTATVRSPGEVSLVGPNPANGFQCFGVSGSTIVGQSGTSTSAQWIFEAATSFSGAITNAKDNTGTDYSFATLCVPFAISSLTGASAYKPTVSGDYVVLGDAATVSEGTLIPAGTPVILVGAKDAGTYTATIKSGTAPVASPVAPTSENVLTGTFAGTSIDTRAATGTNYVLGFDPDNSNRIGFYHVNNENFGLNANRAYLYIAKGGSVKGFTFGSDGADGIKAIDNGIWTMDNAEIFNLAGQRISKLQRGVNIVKGKKFIVK